MMLYLFGYCADKLGHRSDAVAYWIDAAKASPDYCFPSRIEEMIVLQGALCQNRSDIRAHYYLGNLFYDKKRHEEAIREWESSVELEALSLFPGGILGLLTSMSAKTPTKRSLPMTMHSQPIQRFTAVI